MMVCVVLLRGGDGDCSSCAVAVASERRSALSSDAATAVCIASTEPATCSRYVLEWLSCAILVVFTPPSTSRSSASRTAPRRRTTTRVGGAADDDDDAGADEEAL